MFDRLKVRLSYIGCMGPLEVGQLDQLGLGQFRIGSIMDKVNFGQGQFWIRLILDMVNFGLGQLRLGQPYLNQIVG